MEFRTAFTRPRVQTEFSGETMTQQHMAEDCDINNILRRYSQTGVLSHFREGGTYEDLPGAIDFHEAMNLVVQAQEMFDELPSDIRKRFGNDPAQLLQFCEDRDNLDEAIELGLVPRPQTEEPGGADNKPDAKEPPPTPIEAEIDKSKGSAK